MLDLSNNDLGGNGKQDRWITKSLKEFLKHNKMVKELYLSNCSLTSDNIGELLAGLETNDFTGIQLLNFSNNGIGNEGLSYIGQFLFSSNNNLAHLILLNNHITSLSPLMSGLQKKSSLKIVNLGKNIIGDQGAKELAWGLKNNHTIQELHIHDCEIGSDGAAFLASALKFNHTLKILVMNSNKLGDHGVRYFIEVFKSYNRTVNSCAFLNNGITYEIVPDLVGMIEKNCILHDFFVFSEDSHGKSEPSSINLTHLENALTHNFTLTTLGVLRLEEENFHRRRFNPARNLDSFYNEIWDNFDRNYNFYSLYLEYEQFLDLFQNPNLNSEDKQYELECLIQKISIQLSRFEYVTYDDTFRCPTLLELYWFKKWHLLEKDIQNTPCVSLSDPQNALDLCLKALLHITQHIETHYSKEASQFDGLFNYLWVSISRMFPYAPAELLETFNEVNQRLFIPCFQNKAYEEKINLMKIEIGIIWKELNMPETTSDSCEQMKKLEKRLNHAEFIIKNDKEGAHQAFYFILIDLRNILQKEKTNLSIRKNLQFFSNAGMDTNNNDPTKYSYHY